MENRFVKSGGVVIFAASVLVSGAAVADVKVGGRLMVDAVVADDEDNSALTSKQGTEFRRARFFLKGTVAEEFKYKFSVDVADNGLDVKDAYITTDAAGGTLMVGQHRPGGGLDEMTSSKYITMMERNMISSLMPSRRVGLSYKATDGMNTIQGSIYGQEMNSTDETEEGLGAGVRGTMSFGDVNEGLFHLGASAHIEQPAEVAGVSSTRVRFRPENHLANRPLDVTAADAGNTTTVGLEAAFLNGPVAVLAEVATASVDADLSAQEVDATGVSITGSFFINGQKVYKGGSFQRPKINADTAYELAVRYSTMNLEQGSADEDLGVLTIGANIYFNNKTRFMLNYSMANYDDGASTDEDMSSLMGRVSIDF